MNDHRVVSWAIEELNKEQDKPLFLACGIFRPHLPWYAPQKYFDMYPADKVTLPKILDTDLDDVPALGRRMARPQGDHRKVTQSNNYRQAVQGYLASIAFADAQVGRLLNALEKSPQADNTIVVLWGDHGWHLGEKLHWRKFFAVGRSLPRAADDLRTGPDQQRRPLRADRLVHGYLSYAGRPLRFADRQALGRGQPATAAERPSRKMGSPRADDARPQQPRRTQRALPLHPL